MAYVADKRKHRGGFIVLTAVITIAGICLLAFARQNSVRYFGMSVCEYRFAMSISSSGAFLTNAGNAGCIPTVFAYVKFPPTTILAWRLLFFRLPIMSSFIVKGALVVKLLSYFEPICYIDPFRLQYRFLWEVLGQLLEPLLTEPRMPPVLSQVHI